MQSKTASASLRFFFLFSRWRQFHPANKDFPQLSGHLRSNKHIIMTDFHLHEGAENSNPNCVVRLNFLSQPNCMTLLPELNRVCLWKPARVLEHSSTHMKTISHHRVWVNIALRLFIFQQRAADVFARVFLRCRSPRLSKQTERSASGEGRRWSEDDARKDKQICFGSDVRARGCRTCKYADLGRDWGRGRQTEDRCVCAALAVAQWVSRARGLFLRRRLRRWNGRTGSEAALRGVPFDDTSPECLLSPCVLLLKRTPELLSPACGAVTPWAVKAFRQAATGLRVLEEQFF